MKQSKLIKKLREIPLGNRRQLLNKEINFAIEQFEAIKSSQMIIEKSEVGIDTLESKLQAEKDKNEALRDKIEVLEESLKKVGTINGYAFLDIEKFKNDEDKIKTIIEFLNILIEQTKE